MRTLGKDLLYCEHCGGDLTFVEKTYRGIGKATYDCESCGIRFEFERTRDSRILGEKWEKIRAKRIEKPQEKKGT